MTTHTERRGAYTRDGERWPETQPNVTLADQATYAYGMAQRSCSDFTPISNTVD